MADQFPRDDPAAAPEAPRRRAPARKGMLVVYHGDRSAGRASALGVLFRAHGRGLPVRFMALGGADDRPAGEMEALRRLGIPFDELDCGTRLDAGVAWADAAGYLANTARGVAVVEGLLDLVAAGRLSAATVARGLAARMPLLHVIVTGGHAPPEIIDAADLVTEMRAIKVRDPGGPPVMGIDF